jgi:hypothetical protein
MFALKCPRQDSNLYAVSGTGPSNQPVYQFQHVGSARTNARRGTRTLTGLLPQDPESCASTNSAIRAVLAATAVRSASGAEGNRTPDLLNAIQALSQLSYSPGRPDLARPARQARPVLSNNQCSAGLTGLEPATSGVTDRHSNQLSYSPSRRCRRFLPSTERATRFELATFTLAT